MPRRPDTPTAVAFTGTKEVAKLGIGIRSVRVPAYSSNSPRRSHS
jgi:hypothetical protein